MTTILRGNIIHAPALGRLETLERGYLVLEDGVIRGLYPALPEIYRNVPVEDYGEDLILQSFADLHLHAPQYAMVGMGMDLPLLDWLNTYTFPVEARYADLDYARRVYRKLAADLIARQREVMERVTTLCAETEERPVVYLAGEDFLATPAGPMYQNSLISMCGGVCAGAEFSQTGWTEVTADWLLGKDPDRIYMVSYADYTRDDILNEEQYRGLQAIKNNETAFLVFPSAIEPWDILAPSMALGTLWLGHQLHPDMIAEEEYVTEAQTFYRDFFGIEVSAAELLAHGG